MWTCTSSLDARQNNLNAVHHFVGNSSFCQAHVFKVLTPTSNYHKFLICMLFYFYVICKNFIPSKILSSNIISYNANGIFKLWELYHSHLFAGNKQSSHIVFLLGVHVHVVLLGNTRTCTCIFSILYKRSLIKMWFVSAVYVNHKTRHARCAVCLWHYSCDVDWNCFLKGKFSSGREGALASKFNYDFK